MSINIKSIYGKTKEKYKLQLIAGKSGMNHVISWIYVMEDVTTADFIRGSELVFTTGLGIKSEDDFYNMIQILMHQKASGIIVNTGNYIKTIPKAVIDLCNQAGFPLFIMPWETHLVDITQEYCNWIIRDRQKQLNLSECFYHILFQPDKADFSFLKQHNYDIYGRFSVAILGITQELADMDREELNKLFEYEISGKIQRLIQKSCSVVYENKLIIIMQLGMKPPEEIAKVLEGTLKTNDKLQNARVGIGSVSEGIYDLVKSYKHALAAYDLSVKKKSSFVFYDKMNVYKILAEVEDKKVLENIFIDKVHNSKYLDTLKLYLEYNSSIQSVAEKSFTHRNTINYRIKKIKELLTHDLENAKDRFMIQLCFYIRDMQNESDNKK
jgi:DNA-binding PucR family transcriptional regulator